MAPRVLIIGAGRAGQRHLKQAQELGLSCVGVDPNRQDLSWVHYRDLYTALQSERYDYAVIATPPDLHLAALRLLLPRGIPTMCEKPLCDWDQIQEAVELPRSAPLMVAYNYKYHPDLNARQWEKAPTNNGWAMVSIQSRSPIPPWGMVLDHISHDLYILGWMAGDLDIAEAFEHLGQEQHSITISGTVNKETPFLIYDAVVYKPQEKVARLFSPKGQIEITSGPEMFVAMWKAFLAERYIPNVTEAIWTQIMLEEVRSKCVQVKEEVLQ